jgi:hypothetical protein
MGMKYFLKQVEDFPVQVRIDSRNVNEFAPIIF